MVCITLLIGLEEGFLCGLYYFTDWFRGRTSVCFV